VVGVIVAPVIPGAAPDGLLDRLASPSVALPLPALLPDRTRSGPEYAIEVASQPFWLSWDDGRRGR
jgi:hypothetical protein